jgi:hypothetical protein
LYIITLWLLHPVQLCPPPAPLKIKITGVMSPLGKASLKLRKRTCWSTRQRLNSRGKSSDELCRHLTKVSLLYHSEKVSVCSFLRQETKAKEPTFLPVSIRQGTRNVDVVLPADQEHSLGATQIASVPIPWTVFLKNSLSRNRRVLYVTGRC